MSFAVPDDTYGEVVGVAVILKDAQTPTTEEELRKWLREMIASHRVPSYVSQQPCAR